MLHTSDRQQFSRKREPSWPTISTTTSSSSAAGPAAGTLAWKLAPSGKRILILERGPYLPRESGTTGSRRRSSCGPSTTAPRSLAATRRQRVLARSSNYYVGGNTKFYGAALFRLRPRTSGSIHHHGGLSPAWPLSYQDFEPYYTEAEHLYHVHGQARRGPHRRARASGEFPYPAVQHEPRIQQLHDDLEQPGAAPLPPAARASCSTRTSTASRPTPAPASAATGSTASRAWSTARPTPRSSASTRPWRTTTSRSLTDAHVQRLETERDRPQVTAVVADARGRLDGRLLAPTSWWSPAGPSTRPPCCCARPTTPTRGGWPTARTMVAATTCGTTTLARDGPLARSPTRPCYRRRWPLNDWYLRAEDWDYPLGEHPDARQVRRRPDPGEAPRLGRQAVPGLPSKSLAHHARRLLAVRRRTFPRPTAASPSTTTAPSTFI